MSKVHEIVTKQIIESLDKGIIPWVKPWDTIAPHNAESKRKYSGINALLLAYDELGPSYITFNKVKENGGTVKKGTKTRLVTFFSMIENKKQTLDDGSHPKIPLFRYYRVLPVRDVENLPDKFYLTNEVEQVVDADALTEKLGVQIMTGPRACYVPTTDIIYMPHKEEFKSTEEYYQTLFHEVAHWTAHKDRLNRKLSQEKNEYGQEELIAEIASCLLCNAVGITPSINNTVNYCRGWSEAFGKDSKLVVSAAGKAQKVLDWVLSQ